MKTYHKIKTVFERDLQGTKKLILGQYSHELFEYLKDNEWVFTEKIDGTNIRICWDGNRITFSGKSDNAQIPKNLLDYLQSTFGNEETEQMFEQMFGEKETVIFGEGYGKKIQKNGYLYSDEAKFIVFDICIGDTYLEKSDVEQICEALDLECVPIVVEGTLQDGVNFITANPTPVSIIAENTLDMEGIVGVPKKRIFDVCGERVITKIKVRDFRRSN